MSTKQENLYPPTEALPTAPPSYNQVIAPAPQQMPMPQAVHVIQAPIAAPPLGPRPCRMQCPSCHQIQVSKTNYVSNTKTHLMAVILGVTVCCCCIPYCIDSCKSTQHICSNCGAYLGKYEN